MRDRDLYAQILEIADLWHVTDVHLDVPTGKVEVVVKYRGEGCCPTCGKPCPGYDTRLRRWRHLDTCQLLTLLVTDLDGRRVLSVLDGRTRESVDAHFAGIPASARGSVEVAATDMWRPYMDAAAKWRPERRSLLSQLKDVCRRTGRAWALKEMASRLWG